jgi:hypothetical protein
VCAQAVVQSLFLFVPPSLGTAWQNWALVACPVCAIVVLLFFRETYHRLHKDLGGEAAAAAGGAAAVRIRDISAA